MENEAATEAAIDIAFTPREYGVTYRGTLLVETDDMLWRYAVVGTLPKYAPPSAASVRGIDDRLDAQRASRELTERRRDFVAANLHGALSLNESATGRLVPRGKR